MRCGDPLVVLVAVAACGSGGSVYDVEITQITPSAATNIAPIPVQLDGSFARALTNSLDNGKAAIATVEVLIDDTVLTDVVWQDEQRIDATIPAGFAPGLHDITVRIGARSDVLEGGFAITGANLTATLMASDVVFRTSTFTVTMTVTNTGVSAADALDAPDLMSSGSAVATLMTGPTGGASLAPGASTTLTFDYVADNVGTIVFTGHATGVDSLSGLAVTSPDAMSNVINILEVTTVIADPLGDSSPFGFVAGYQNRVYIGPSQTGTTLSRVMPDGTGLETGLTMTFAQDTTGNGTDSSAATYTSIGFTGCTANTTCGPDNENGRGLFTSAVLGGGEWLVIGGARSGGDLDYIYMTNESDTALDFRYVDLSSVLGPATKGFSAAHVLGTRLYLGFPDTGGSKPYFIALSVPPAIAPGLDAAAGSDVIDLRGDAFPGFPTSSPAMIDSMGDLNGLLYVANRAAVFGARTPAPGAYNTTEWQNVTPADSSWGNRTSVTPTKEYDLAPADRAIPAFAGFGGRLFMARNTTTGPQLWSCNPGLGIETFRCEAGDWELVAPNSTNDLTQFNNTSHEAITMLVSTSTFLYVGFDSPSGAQVYRTGMSTALQPMHFEGLGGCTANLSTCAGIGGAGLGDATSTRIFDAKSLTLAGIESVWITVGNTTSAARLVMIP